MEKNTEKTSENTKKIMFSAINPYEEIVIPDNEERDSRKGFITWGNANDYPNYLNDLYKGVSTLHSIIEGTVDFIVGNGVNAGAWETINGKGETIDELVRNCSRDYLKYGGFAINVLRNKMGKVVELHYIPFERLRSNEDNTVIYYCKNWLKSYGVKFISYPAFNKDGNDASSIYYYTNDKSNTYPTSKWEAAVKACEIERSVNDYHLNGIKNGFAANYAISFNNGVPNENQADEIERNVMEKFGGEKNSGRILISFADSKDHELTLSKLDTDDVGERYKSLIERTKSEIFTSFRAIPNLFGLPTATGFSNEEYESAFELYNKTAIEPIQRIIKKAIKGIIDTDIEIIPFTLTTPNNKNQ